MNRTNIGFFVAAVFVAVSAESVVAQGLGPRPMSARPGPTVSPYINLVRPGTTPAINYYGIVRPQLETNANLQFLRQGLLSPGVAAPGSSEADGVLITGRTAGFMTHQSYFMTTGVPNASRSAGFGTNRNAGGVGGQFGTPRPGSR
jgi:hypothetical protein